MTPAQAQFPSATHSGGTAPGFTLVELLVSVAILSGGIVLVLQALDSCLVALDASRDSLLSVYLLDEKLAEVRATALTAGMDGMDRSDDFEAPFEEYEWVLQKSAEPVAESPSGSNAVCEVSLTVQRRGSRRSSSATMYVTTRR